MITRSHPAGFLLSKENRSKQRNNRIVEPE
ncbi:hypothetical protein VP199E371_P0081 [Vibrio phage 199E37-1]|nr:hypothetical protein VP199E371_P0081 [Vibrio phage 199E37-1]